MNDQTSTTAGTDGPLIEDLRQARSAGRDRWARDEGSVRASSRPQSEYREHPDGTRSVSTPPADDAG